MELLVNKNINTPLPACPHCKVKVPYMKKLSSEFHKNIPKYEFFGQFGPGITDFLWYFYKCNVCNECVMIYATNITNDNHFYVLLSHPSSNNKIIEHEAIPKHIRLALKDSSESPAPSSIVMTTSAIDAMLMDKGDYNDRLSFHDKIEQALQDNLIPEDIAIWAHKIRINSNDVRHPTNAKTDTRPTDEEAKQAFNFATILAEIFYIYPSLIPVKDTEESQNAPILNKQTNLKRLLVCIGKTVFIEWLEKCKENYPNSQSEMIAEMQEKEDFTLNSCRSRVSKIYRIIREDLVVEACEKVVTSKNAIITDDIKQRAKQLKDKYSQ
ncbi:MAG: DUF4145 domain-containing protein [Alphaproteobacteria bacterium]|nr:DUF4145 domain-containing protein [Alphaproteobacteria bacterium]